MRASHGWLARQHPTCPCTPELLACSLEGSASTKPAPSWQEASQPAGRGSWVRTVPCASWQDGEQPLPQPLPITTLRGQLIGTMCAGRAAVPGTGWSQQPGCPSQMGAAAWGMEMRTPARAGREHHSPATALLHPGWHTLEKGPCSGRVPLHQGNVLVLVKGRGQAQL